MILPLFTAGFTAALLPGVYLPRTGWILPAGFVCLLLGLLLGKRRLRPRLVLLGAGIALLWLAAYGAIVHAPAQALENRTVRLEAVVTNWPEETDYGVRIPVRAGEAGGRQVSALFYGDYDLADLRPGDGFSCIAHCTPADRMRGQESLYYTAKGVLLQIRGYGTVTVTEAEGISPRYALILLAGEIREVIGALYDPPYEGFLNALLTGTKAGLTDTDTNNFNRVGLGHVVVISGLHVSFLLGLLSVVLKPGSKGALAVLILILVGFSLMTGNAPGTVRAVILGGVVLTGQYLGRESHPLAALSAGLLFLLAVNPCAIASASLQFSFLSTAGIFLFGSPWAMRWVEHVPQRHRFWAGPLLTGLAVSLGCMIPTVPLSALYFERFSLIAPLANLCTGWAVSLAFVGGILSVAAGALFLPLGHLLAMAVEVPIDFFLWFSAKASGLSLAALALDSSYYALWAVFVYGILCLYLLVPGRRKRPVLPVCACLVTLCLSVILTVQSARRADLTVTVLDVGQGQSVVLTAGDRCALVDCGGTTDPGDTAATWLQSRGWGEIDLLILTHYHEDHAGGVPELLGRIGVKTIVLPDVDPSSPRRQEIEDIAETEGIALHYIKETGRAKLAGAELTLFPPLPGSEASNEMSVAVLFGKDGWETLITGDMPREQETRLAAREKLPETELLVVGHHGSRHSTGQALLEAIRPELAAISVGYNTYGHPTRETLDRLEAWGADIYRTDRMGTITFTREQGG